MCERSRSVAVASGTYCNGIPSPARGFGASCTRSSAVSVPSPAGKSRSLQEPNKHRDTLVEWLRLDRARVSKACV